MPFSEFEGSGKPPRKSALELEESLSGGPLASASVCPGQQFGPILGE